MLKQAIKEALAETLQEQRDLFFTISLLKSMKM